MTNRTRIAFLVLLSIATVTLWPAEAAAQRRGRAGGRASTVVVASGYYGYGLYDPFFWGDQGWYPYGPYSPYDRAGFYPYENVGSARIQVTPRDAEVYVDGYLAGTVDNFDGFLQRLEVPAGEHEITLYLAGYRTIRQKVLFKPGTTLKISYAMEHLAQGAADEPRPQPEPGSAPPSAGEARPRGGQPVRSAPDASRFGTLAIRIQPADAAVFVDGEEWTGATGAGPLLIELGDGSHDVEVRKQGFTTFQKTVRVRGGETVALNVSLAR